MFIKITRFECGGKFLLWTDAFHFLFLKKRLLIEGMGRHTDALISIFYSVYGPLCQNEQLKRDSLIIKNPIWEGQFCWCILVENEGEKRAFLTGQIYHHEWPSIFKDFFSLFYLSHFSTSGVELLSIVGLYTGWIFYYDFFILFFKHLIKLLLFAY